MTTLAELKANIDYATKGGQALMRAVVELNTLNSLMTRTINTPDKFRAAPTDAEADNIKNIYTPQYLAAAAKVKQCYEALGFNQLP